MTWYNRALRESCTYWSPPIKDAWGKPTYPSPTTIACAWQEKTQLFIDKEGQQSHSHAVVLLAAQVEVDGRLFHGESDEDNPLNEPASDVIRRVDTVRTIRGDVVTYKAFL